MLKADDLKKEESYEAESVTEKGYRLISSQDALSEAEITACLDTSYIGRQLLVFDETDSTNEELKRRQAELKDGAAAIADHQKAGKGRRGRVWQTPPGESIALSIFLKPDLAPDEASMLTLVAALAVYDVCKETGGIEPLIKWPNDLVLDGKKFCGILTEMSAKPDHIDYVIVGIGINVNGSYFPEEIRDTATSLFLGGGHRLSRARIAAAVLNRFEKRYEDFLKDRSLASVTDEYNSVLAGRGSAVTVMDAKGEYNGISRGIDERGELLVETEGGLGRVYAGEVSVRGIYGYV